MVARWCAVVPVGARRGRPTVEGTKRGPQSAAEQIAILKAWARGVVFEVCKSHDLGNGVKFERWPDWLAELKLRPGLREAEAADLTHVLTEPAQWVFQIEYEDDALYGRGPSRGRRSPEAVAPEKILLANLALCIVKPSFIKCDLVIHAERADGRWYARSVLRISPMMPHPSDSGAVLSDHDLDQARGINEALASLDRKGAVWVAARALEQALHEEDWALRYILFWIALEALFGPKDGRELTYRLSQRIAFFLASDRSDADQLIQKATKGYKMRSKIVHGAGAAEPKKKKEESWGEARELVTKALTRILSETDLRKQFENQRESFLEDLIFSRQL